MLKGMKRLSGKGVTMLCLLCSLSMPCFADEISDTAKLERQFTMIGFFLLILVFSGIMIPLVKANKKGSQVFVIFQIILNLMFSVLILKMHGDDFFFKYKLAWVAVLWCLAIIMTIIFARNNKIKPTA